MEIFNFTAISKRLTGNPKQITKNYKGKRYKISINELKEFEKQWIEKYKKGNMARLDRYNIDEYREYLEDKGVEFDEETKRVLSVSSHNILVIKPNSNLLKERYFSNRTGKQLNKE